MRGCWNYILIVVLVTHSYTGIKIHKTKRNIRNKYGIMLRFYKVGYSILPLHLKYFTTIMKRPKKRRKKSEGRRQRKR